MLHCPACHRPLERPAGASVPFACPHCGSLVVGSYCDLELIGSGAMGDVFRARRPDMGDRTVAIKIPKAAEPQVCRRFEREIAASARLRHENIICAFDRGEVEGRPYLVMEYVAGRPLADIIDAEHPLSPARVARILLQVASGLAHAATQRIVNRDIKPDNILIAHDTGTAKILDYGLGLIADLDGSAERVTRTGTLLGTPSFLAPEQARDPRGVSIAADVYALGCTAYYALTRRTPFSATDSQAIVEKHATAPRPSVRAMRPDVDAELDQLIQQMMAVSPEARPAPKDLVRRLEQLLPRLSDAKPPVASTTVAGMIDVACPGCGETYHLRADAAGKPMTCRNNLCKERFVIGPHVAVTQVLPPQDGDDLPVLAAEAVEAEAIEAEAVEAEAVEAEAVEAVEAVEAEVAEVAEPVEAVEAVEALVAEPADGVYPPPDDAEPEVLPMDAVVAVGAMSPPRDVPPIIETVAVSAAHIDTPKEDSIDMLPASAIVSAPAGAPPPMMGAAMPYQAGAPYHAGATAAAPGAAGNASPAAFSPAAQPGSRGAQPGTKDKSAGKPVSRRQKRTRLMTTLMLSSVVLLAAGAGGMFWWVYEPPTAEKDWKQVQEVYLEQKWTRAEERFQKFLETWPDDAHAKEVPYFLAMCKAGPEIFSDTGNVERGLTNAEEIFKQHRDTEVYNLYATDLHKALARLIERFTDQAVKGTSPAKIEGARRAEVLLATVSQAMKEEWLAGENMRLAKLINDSEQKVRLAVARKEIVSQLTAAQTTEPLPNVDELYARVEQLLAEHPSLRGEKEIVTLQDTAWRAEAARVRFIPYEPGEGEEARALDSAAADGTQYVVWNGRQAASPGSTGDRVVMALARGVLYVFDPQGNFLWARRLGVDTHRLPGQIDATLTSPAALIAVSSEDNTLLALEATTGRVLWRYPVGGDIVAPLTIVNLRGGPNAPDKKRGFLPTTNSDGTGGVIHVLELVLGKRMGHFEVGQPMTVGGTYDPTTGLVYFPADSKRVFAINPAAIDDPKAPACRSVLFTEHASGALRSEPAVVGQYTIGQQYFIMPEASELEGMKLRAFDLKAEGFPDPKAAPLKEAALRGWSWFAARTTPDRITLVTDDGDLGVFGLNLDNRDEALYRLVDDPSMHLNAGDRFRALAVHADEHLLWVMAGGVLRKFSLDLLKQKVRPIWPKGNGATSTNASQNGTVSGVPIHEAQMDKFGTVFYLTTMSASGDRYDLTAVDSDSGEVLWQRQLGVNPAGDPLVDAAGSGRALLVDRSGGIVELAAGAGESEAELPRAAEQSGTGELPAGADPREIVRLDSVQGPARLFVPLTGREQLALATLDDRLARSATTGATDSDDSASTGAALTWQTLKLDKPLQGRPGLVACDGRRPGGPSISPEEFLIAPTAGGLLRRLPLDPEVTTLVNEIPFQWSDAVPPPPLATAEVYPLGHNALLLVDGQRCVRRLEFRTEPVPQWEMAGSAFEPQSAIIKRPLILTSGLARSSTSGGPASNPAAYVLTADGVLQAIDLADPSRVLRSWDIPGRVTSELFSRGGYLFAIVEERKLVCIDPAAGESREPLWQSDPTKGRIRGEPTLAGDVLLVADDSRYITARKLSDGSRAWAKRIGVRAGPSAAATLFGKDRILVPLTDGTLWTMPLPEEKAEATP